jgi:hypothetical protein
MSDLLQKEFKIGTCPVTEPYVCSLESRAASGGLGLHTAFAGGTSKPDMTPPGLGLHTAIPSDVWENLAHTIR